jgi:hypothetical protein
MTKNKKAKNKNRTAKQQTSTGNSYEQEKMVSAITIIKKFIDDKMTGKIIFSFHNGNFSNKFAVEISEDLRTLNQSEDSSK